MLVTMVELPFRKGALTEVIDQDNNTPLHLAAHRNYSELVKLPLSNDASIVGKEPRHGGECGHVRIYCLSILFCYRLMYRSRRGNRNEGNKVQYFYLPYPHVNGPHGIFGILVLSGQEV